MSRAIKRPRTKSHDITAPNVAAAIFAALGDPTRLALVAALAGGKCQSIVELSLGARITRQAITKHLRVLEDVGLVHGRRLGRQNLFELDPKPIMHMQEYLSLVSLQWEEALGRLKSFVEKPND